ncbi:nucleolar pre-ribosomal-associated protein 1-like isoform X1 [Branchiostoma lanceolatum]|uniref:nucleolar pre-ribosomal-associated protein 1-like isoform X1 n=1 Tax=Branchiostoma lanceolatum TaxID=7740 RepID=UPI003453EE8A
MKKRKSQEKEGVEESKAKKVRQEKTEFSAAMFRTMLNDKTQRIAALQKFVARRRNQEKTEDIIKDFLQVSPECVEILKLLDEPPLDQEVQLIFRCLEAILMRTVDLPQFHIPSIHVVQKLSHQYSDILIKTLRLLNNTSCVMSTLKLLTAMASHGAQAARDVLRLVDSALPTLIGMLHRADKKDVRACVISLVVSFLLTDDKTVILQLLQYKDLMRYIFKNLPGDHLSSVRLLLTTLRDMVVRSEFVSKTAKIHLFTNQALHQLSLLYNWTGRVDVSVSQGTQEMSEGQQKKEGRLLVRQLVHDFLLELCCDFRNGINFHDKTLGTSGRNMNQVLHKFLLDLRQANRDPLMAELVIRVLKACPDLVNRYLSDVTFSFSPRPSAQWKENMALLTEIYQSQSDISPVFDLPEPRPAEEVISMVMVTAVPSAIKPVVAQGIKHAEASVRGTTCSLLVCVLQRVFKVICHCQDTQHWTNHAVYSVHDMERVVVLLREALVKMLPDVNTIISAWLAARKQDRATLSTEETQSGKGAVLLDVDGVLHVLRLYQQVLPDHFLQSNYDFSKLLHDTVEWVLERGVASPWLHVMNILGRLPKGRIKWHKEEKGLRTACYQHMQVFSDTSDVQVVKGTKELLVKVLSDTGLFDHTLEEAELWLRHLRLLETPEERDQVLTFLDKVLTRGVRNPYPFADKVAEMIVEDSSFTSDKVNTTESDLEAILDTNSAIEDEDILEDSQPISTSLLPFSAFVPALLEDCRSMIQKVLGGTIQPGVANNIHSFMTPAVLDLLHSQMDPLPLCLTLRQHLAAVQREVSTTSKKLAPQPWIADCNTLAQVVDEFLSTKELPTILIETSPCDKLVKRLQKDLAVGRDDTSVEFCRSLCERMRKLDTSSLDLVADSFLHFCLKNPAFVNFVAKLARTRRLPDPVVVTLSQSCKVISTATLLFQSTNRQLLHQQVVKDAVLSSIKLLKDSEFVFTAKCVLLSLKRALGSLTSSQASSNVAGYFTFLHEILQAFWETQHREVLDGDAGKDKMEDLEETILNHPMVNSWFLKSKMGNRASDAVSEVMSEETCKMMASMMHRSPSKSTQDRVQHLIRKIVTILRQEIGSSQNKSEWTEGTLTLNLFSCLLFCADAEVVQEVVDDLSTLPRRVLLSPERTYTSETKLHLCGKVLHSGVQRLLLDTGRQFQVSSCCFLQLFELLYVNRNLDIRTTLLRLLDIQACPAKLYEDLPIHLSDETVQVEALLVEQSSVYRARLKDYFLTNSNSEKLRSWEISCIPLMNAYLKATELANETESAHQVFQVLPGQLQLSGQNYDRLGNYVLLTKEDDLPGSMELVARLLRLNANASQTRNFLDWLMEILSSPETPLRRWQVALDLLKDLPDQDKEENDILCGRFLVASWKGLTALWKKKKDVAGTLSLQENENCLLENMQKFLENISSKEIVVGKDSKSAWAKFVKTGLRYNMENSLFLRMLCRLTEIVYAADAPDQSLTLPTLYQMIWSHSHFLSIIMARPDGKAEAAEKGDLVELLFQLVTMDTTGCTNQHIPVLLGAYDATLSKTDQTLLCILHVYEEQGFATAEFMPWLWGVSSVEHYQMRKNFGPSLWQQPGMEDVLKLVEKDKMHQSVLNFPVSRSLKPQVCEAPQAAGEMYDPCFFLPLFASVLTPECVVDCRRFVESHCLGFVLAGLASNDADVRAASCHVLSLFYQHLEGARFAEKRQLLYLLQCLQNGIHRPNLQVPNIVTLFLARTIQLLLQPDEHMYPLVCRYLLVRPDLDLKAIPEFHIMFFSTSMEYKTERSWILTLLVDGLRDKQDFLLYQNKSVFSIALTFYESPLSDEHSKSLVMSLLQKACCIKEAAESLCQKHGLLSWLHALVIRRKGEAGILSQIIQLLHRLWSTLLGTARSISSDREVLSEIQTTAQTQTTVTPQLAQEVLLVCSSILESLG